MVYTMGFLDAISAIFASTSFFLETSASFFFCFPSASAVAHIKSISSIFPVKSSTICFCSPFVSRPFPIIFSSSLFKYSTLSPTSTMLLYIACSCSVRLFCSVSNFSSISKALTMTFKRFNNALFWEKEGTFMVTSSWNSSNVQDTHWNSGDWSVPCVPVPSAPLPLASSFTRSSLGNTCRYFRSLSVSCWYLYMPWHISHALAPRSSSSPCARSAMVRCISMSGSYLERVFLPPPITNLHAT
mmetsp:Transcript_7100/g.23775  ORF Transcript_7100/g.23775 Transcript_7100/m.23775 type:complete len:243 (+) Transcript_7100:436-1164(+)